METNCTPGGDQIDGNILGSNQRHCGGPKFGNEIICFLASSLTA